MSAKTLFGLFTIWLLFISCNKDNRPLIEFYGEFDSVSVFQYEIKNFNFYSPGLSEALSDSSLDSARVSISTLKFHDPGTALTKENYQYGDSMTFRAIGELINIDYEPEQFNDSAEIFPFFGALDVYYKNGSKIELRDTVNLRRINPLMNSKMNGVLINNKRQGKWQEYYDLDHEKLARTSTFSNGLRQGSDTVYFKSGKIKIISNWKDGKKHGRYTSFYENSGKVESEVYFENGLPVSKLYYYNGKGNIYDSLDLYKL